MRLFYSIYVYLLKLGISLASPFKPKAKKWIQGRKNWAENLSLAKSKLPDAALAWFHVSSLGEYEQALPLIKKIKEKGYTVALSFFSSSGFEHAHSSLVDIKFYLPQDTQANAKKLLDLLDPKMVFWIKNDFWIHTLEEINRRSIPLLMTSMIFHDDSFFINSGFGLVKKSLSNSHIFSQNKSTTDLLNKKGLQNVITTGDTRITRVINRKKTVEPNSILTRFKENKELIFYASVHQSDKEIIAQSIKNNSQFKHVIIPHEIDDRSVQALVKGIDKSMIFYDDFETIADENILIVNKIGLLFNLYQYADIVYIGGGFGKGIHNILEPTVFGKVVLFGPNYKKFDEANNFIKHKWSYAIHNPEEFINTIDQLTTQQKNTIHSDLFKFYDEHLDATAEILTYCRHQNLFN